uniref:Nucleoporin NUP42 n=1 Tax=Electrophorus electricus TaxID=8005 RepID=A0A4W4GEU9_ELEEL
MSVCHFFLQGRCRYGEKCWNEHPRGGRGSGGDYQPGHQSNQSNRFGNRVWINPSQRSGGGGRPHPSTPSRGGVDWGGGSNGAGGGFGFSQNRFSTLNSQSNFDGGAGSGDENEKHLEAIQKDMEVWQSSGQWPFSTYSILKAPISGFVELSPEELRLEYYTRRSSGDVESYINSVQQLANQWRDRVQELRIMNPSTRVAMTAELSNPRPSGGGLFSSSSSGFSLSSSSGFQAGGFGSSLQSSATFCFSSATTGFGSSGARPGPSGFGSVGVFGSAATPATPSASAFSFTAPAAAKTSAAVSGSVAGFSFSSSSTPSASAAGLGSGFGSSTPAGGGVFGLVTGSSSGFIGGASELYTPQSELTANELKEFTAARFTLGQIPLRPPPAELLTV